jgi:hypothetical protein
MLRLPGDRFVDAAGLEKLEKNAGEIQRDFEAAMKEAAN